MRETLRAFILTLFAWLMASPAIAKQSKSVDTGKVVASLVSSHDSVRPGQDVYIALRTVLDEGWHTYWRNPGDSGEPVQISWQLPDGVTAGEINWPLPRPIPTGPIVNYGFEGTPLFPVKFEINPNVKIGNDLTITADFYYLVCGEICIPEQGSASLTLTIGDVVEDAQWRGQIETALAASAKRGSVNGAIEKSGETVSLSFTNLPEGDFSKSYFFPYDQGVLGHSTPQNVTVAAEGLRLSSSAEFLWNGDMISI